MVIFDANRFGLSTLHQLRGRVGRGEDEAKCILISDTDTKRLHIMEKEMMALKLVRKTLNYEDMVIYLGLNKAVICHLK